MSVSLAIHPHADHLSMYGDPDPTSAYSLSGHVSISFSPSNSFLGTRQTARYLLKSLSLTFEGQAEIFTQVISYSAVRLCTITRELVPVEEGIELSNEGHEESGKPSVWNIVFNITVPGWLPASIFSPDNTGVRYGLYATATLIDLDETRGPWGLAALCAPFWSRTKIVQSEQAVGVYRYAAPPSHEPHAFGTVNYLVKNPTFTSKDGEEKRISYELLSKIQVLLSVPEFVNIDEKKLSVTLRMRADGLSEEDCKRIQLVDVQIDLHQMEKCRSRPSTNYATRYPLPPPKQQPPNEPLLNPSPVGLIFDVGVFPLSSRRCDAISRTLSLLPPNETGKHKLSENNYIFADMSSSDGQLSWYTLDMQIPFADKATALSDKDVNWNWPPALVLRPTVSTPLFVVCHQVAISATCSYNHPGTNEVIRARLNFSVPVTFGLVAPSPEPPMLQASSSEQSSMPSLPVVEPYAPTLPAYSQLYDTNGERRVDYSVPLPLYTPAYQQDNGATASVRASLEVANARRKWDCAPQPDSDDDAETAPLLGTSSY